MYIIRIVIITIITTIIIVIIITIIIIINNNDNNNDKNKYTYIHPNVGMPPIFKASSAPIQCAGLRRRSCRGVWNQSR